MTWPIKSARHRAMDLALGMPAEDYAYEARVDLKLSWNEIARMMAEDSGRKVLPNTVAQWAGVYRKAVGKPHVPIEHGPG